MTSDQTTGLADLLAHVGDFGLFGWGKKEEELHPRGTGGRFITKGGVPLLGKRLTNIESLYGEHGGSGPGRRKRQPGDVVGMTKDGKQRLRIGPGHSGHHDVQDEDGTWRSVERTKSDLDLVPGNFDRDSPGKRHEFFPPAWEDGSPPTADLPEQPSQMSPALAAEFDAAATEKAALLSPEKLPRDFGWDGPEHTALRKYQGEGYSAINAKARDERVGHRDIDAAMRGSKLQQDVVVWRGTKDGRAVFGDNWDPTPGSMVGLEYRDDAYASTSTSKSVGLSFAHDQNGAVLRILARTGIPAVTLLDKRDEPGKEDEILLDRGLKYRIVGDRITNGVRALDVEVIQ